MMKKDMFDYIDKLSGKDFKTLEKIISFQYRKFIRFYRLVESYSGIITKVKYNFISPSSLDVVLTFNTKRDLGNIKKEMLKSMDENGYEGVIEHNKKNMSISITLEEEVAS